MCSELRVGDFFIRLLVGRTPWPANIRVSIRGYCGYVDGRIESSVLSIHGLPVAFKWRAVACVLHLRLVSELRAIVVMALRVSHLTHF